MNESAPAWEKSKEVYRTEVFDIPFGVEEPDDEFNGEFQLFVIEENGAFTIRPIVIHDTSSFGTKVRLKYEPETFISKDKAVARANELAADATSGDTELWEEVVD